MDKPRKRHCWECRRRYLVCDSTEPACKRCIHSGAECPGYDDVKPPKLKWLAPGKVTSRPRRRKAKSPRLKEEDSNEMEGCMQNQQIVAQADAHLAFPFFEIKTDAHAFAEGIEYFNSCIYPDLLPLHALGQNPHIYPLSTAIVRAGILSPDYLRFGMLCMILSHRINRTRGELVPRALGEKFYMYWGVAVRALIESLKAKDVQFDDTVLAGIMTLLLADVQQGTSLNWRSHLQGVHRLISLRGGFDVVARSRNLEPMLLCFWFFAIFGNTTCPASELSMTRSHLDALNFLLERYGNTVFCFHMCPLPLVAEIIRTNHLRMRAKTKIAQTNPDYQGHFKLMQEAYRILERVDNFSSEEWSASKPASIKDWILIGQVYQAAVSLYVILSLQDLSVLPRSSALRARCVSHRQFLQWLLSTGLSCPRINRFLVWPLVVLGVEAAYGCAETRAFVERRLPDLSRDVGTHVPLTAKRVLERYWSSGVKGWDACFDKAYVFTMQFAVDTSRLPLSLDLLSKMQV